MIAARPRLRAAFVFAAACLVALPGAAHAAEGSGPVAQAAGLVQQTDAFVGSLPANGVPTDPAGLGTSATALSTRLAELGQLLEADAAAHLASSSSGAERDLGTAMGEEADALAKYATALADTDPTGATTAAGAVLTATRTLDGAYRALTSGAAPTNARGAAAPTGAATPTTASSSGPLSSPITRLALLLTGGVFVLGLLAKVLQGRRDRRPSGMPETKAQPVYKPVLASLPEPLTGEMGGLFGLAGHVEAAPLAGFGAGPVPSSAFQSIEAPAYGAVPMAPASVATAPGYAAAAAAAPSPGPRATPPPPPPPSRPMHPGVAPTPVPPPPPVPVRGPMVVATAATVPPPPPPR